MNSSSTKVRELTKITVLLGGSKCEHYDYDDVLKQLSMKITPPPPTPPPPPPPNISFQEEQTLEKLLLEVFHEEKSNPDNKGFGCKGWMHLCLVDYRSS